MDRCVVGRCWVDGDGVLSIRKHKHFQGWIPVHGPIRSNAVVMHASMYIYIYIDHKSNMTPHESHNGLVADHYTTVHIRWWWSIKYTSCLYFCCQVATRLVTCQGLVQRHVGRGDLADGFLWVFFFYVDLTFFKIHFHGLVLKLFHEWNEERSGLNHWVPWIVTGASGNPWGERTCGRRFGGGLEISRLIKR